MRPAPRSTGPSPRSPGRAPALLLPILLALGVLHATACDRAPTEPGADPAMEPMAAAGGEEIALSLDPDLSASAVEAVEAVLGPDADADARSELDGARRAFDDARHAHRNGRRDRARRHGDRARRHLDRALARPDRTRNGRYGRLQVARAHAAVGLAGRLLEDVDASERQLRWLQRARRLATAASEALDNGHPAGAVRLALEAVTTSLQAVLLPEPTLEEARRIQAAAGKLVEAARETIDIGPGAPTDALIRRIVLAYEKGSALLEEGNLRGVGPIWHAGVTAAVLAEG